MKRKLAAVVTAAAVAVGGGVWTGMSSASAGDSSLTVRGWPAKGSAAAAERFAADKGGRGDRTLVVYSRELRGQGVDVGRRGESPGDYFVFEGTAETRGGKRIGGVSVRCMLIVRTFRCDGTIRLHHHGKLEIAGSFFGPRDNRVSVTGGTGRFIGVGGVMRLFDEGGGDRVQLVFRLVH